MARLRRRDATVMIYNCRIGRASYGRPVNHLGLFSQPPISAVISSRLQIMPGRRAFLRRRHVAAGASRANCGPYVPTRPSLLSVASSRVLERHCCRAASGARAAGGPARRVGLPPGTWGSCDCRHRYPAEVTSEPATLPPVPSSLSVVRLRASADEGSPRCRPVLRRGQASDNVSPPQQKPLGGYGEDTQKWA
jgi:hypothetical protein